MTAPQPTLEEMVARVVARYEWRYIYRGAVAHATGLKDTTPRAIALCGVGPQWSAAYGWLGTGNQEEYERVASLRKCKRCTDIMIVNARLPIQVDGRTHQLAQRPGSQAF